MRGSEPRAARSHKPWRATEFFRIRRRASRRDGRRVYYALASDRVAELWAAVRDVASQHVAEVAVLADDYLGSRDEVELISTYLKSGGDQPNSP